MAELHAVVSCGNESARPPRHTSASLASVPDQPAASLVDASGGDALWVPRYGSYDQELTVRRLASALKIVRRHGHQWDAVEAAYDVTIERISHAFALYEGREVPRSSASFAFLVPARLSRYCVAFQHEADTMLPFFRYLDGVSKQLISSSLCPFVLDRYEATAGRGGIMVSCPIGPDLLTDMGLPAAVRAARHITQDAVGFVRERFGVNIVGLGAVLPSLTNYGRSIHVPGCRVTTGHAGTAWLAASMVHRTACTTGADEASVIGAGAIGSVIARAVLDGREIKRVTLYDTELGKAERLAEQLRGVGYSRVVAAQTVEQAFGSPVIIGATTTPVDIGSAALARVDLSGKIIIDDSQPSSFDIDQAESRGAAVCWVVGSDHSPRSTCTRVGYWDEPFDYGGSGPARPGDVWGCEAEVHALWHTGALDLAVTGPVQPADVLQLGNLCEEAGTAIASPQRRGELTDLELHRPLAANAAPTSL
ncbi:MAG: hypothetical protein JWL70_1295 [Acidimicrobiia bacterium]|nr:hypothetical protein [Acidimicrobiia bacterium]